MLPSRAVSRLIWGSDAAAAEAIGPHALWGFSSAVDLLRHRTTDDKVDDEEDETPVSVLLLGPGDVRHVLATLAARRSRRPLHFYVVDSNPEIVARHVLLLKIAFDWALPLKQRASALLEVYGNLHLQERTERYVGRLGRVAALTVLLEDDDDDAADDVFDFSKLKFKDRDLIATQLRSYDASAFDPAALWEHRLRSQLGDRYDHREGAFDWDYRIGLQAAAPVVHVKQYRQWRATGLAFEFGDCVYDRPNRTLSTYAQGLMRGGKAKGEKREVKGYWGDTVVSPYVALGVDTDAGARDALFEVVDKGRGTEQQRHNATEVATYNLLAYLWQLETDEPYKLHKAHNIYSGLLAADLDKQTTADASGFCADALRRAECIVNRVDGLKIIPVVVPAQAKEDPAPPWPTILRRCGGVAFDAVFSSIGRATFLEARDPALKPTAVVYAETAKYLVPLKKAERHLFAKKVRSSGTRKY